MDDIINYKQSKKNPKWVKRVVATAAAAAIIIGCSLGFGTYQKANAAETFVSIDAGGNVTIGVNSKDKVVSVSGNSAGIAKSDVKGTDVDEAVKTITDKMVETGEITSENNVVLVSVEKMAEKAKQEIDQEVTGELQDAAKEHEEGVADVNKEIEEELADVIEETLAGHGIDGTVIGQKFDKDETLKEIADKLAISDGKASFIQKILEGNTTGDGIQMSDLAKKSISEIVQYASAWLTNAGVNIGATGSDASDAGASDANQSAGVKVGTDANINVQSGDGLATAHVDANNGKVKVDVGGNQSGDFALGVEVKGNKFTYDSGDPAGSVIGIIGSIIKAS